MVYFRRKQNEPEPYDAAKDPTWQGMTDTEKAEFVNGLVGILVNEKRARRKILVGSTAILGLETLLAFAVTYHGMNQREEHISKIELREEYSERLSQEVYTLLDSQQYEQAKRLLEDYFQKEERHDARSKNIAK